MDWISGVNCSFNNSIDRIIHHAIVPGVLAILYIHAGEHDQVPNIMKSFLRIDARSSPKIMATLVCDPASCGFVGLTCSPHAADFYCTMNITTKQTPGVPFQIWESYTVSRGKVNAPVYDLPDTPDFWKFWGAWVKSTRYRRHPTGVNTENCSATMCNYCWLVVWLPFLAFIHTLGIIIPID